MTRVILPGHTKSKLIAGLQRDRAQLRKALRAACKLATETADALWAEDRDTKQHALTIATIAALEGVANLRSKIR